jgi:hypothetical protein
MSIGTAMKKIIVIFVCILSFMSLSAKEQVIVIKTSGGAERQVLGKNNKPTGETFIGYSKISLKQENAYDNITLNCSEEGWEPCELDRQTVTVKCAYEDLIKLAFGKIKKGELKGMASDKMTEGKKRYSRTVKWTSTGLIKSTQITIILDDSK